MVLNNTFQPNISGAQNPKSHSPKSKDTSSQKSEGYYNSKEEIKNGTGAQIVPYLKHYNFI